MNTKQNTTLKPNNFPISFNFILGIYLIVPLCVFAYVLDIFFFDSYLKKTLPIAPEHFSYLALLFGTPHIVASNVILVTNKEYFNTYKWKVLIATLAIIAFFTIGNEVLSYTSLFVIVATITVTHVVKQQLGIGNMMAKLSGPIYQTWLWSSIAASVIMYNDIFIGWRFQSSTLQTMKTALIVLIALIVISATILYPQARKNNGARFFISNTLLVLISLFLYKQKYYFFAILGPRLVHDTTAFVFYAVHDLNQHWKEPQNYLYAFFRKIWFHPFIAVPIIAIFLTFVMQEYGDGFFDKIMLSTVGTTYPRAISFVFVGYLGMLHYFTESFTWKGASPYRKYIAFKR